LNLSLSLPNRGHHFESAKCFQTWNNLRPRLVNLFSMSCSRDFVKQLELRQIQKLELIL
jgi:hypothetical protein